MKFGTGLSLTYAYKENYAWRIFLDYDFTRKKYTLDYSPGEFIYDAFGWTSEDFADATEIRQCQTIKKNRNTFIIGGSFTISF